MEEVYTCTCGCQAWSLQETKIRCAKCGKCVPADELISFDELISSQEFNAHIRAVEGVKKGVESG